MQASKRQDLTAAAKRAVMGLGYPLFLRLAKNGLPGYDKNFRRFVVVTPGRSGSTFLLQRLNSHPEITCYGEMLHKGAVHFGLPYVGALHIEIDPARESPMDFLEKHVWRAHRRPVGAVGAKLIYNQILVREEEGELLDKLRDVAVIMLHRRDIMGMYLSLQRALSTQVFAHTSPGELELQQKPFRVKPQHCETYFEHVAFCEKLYGAVFDKGDLFDLDYEDLADDPESFDAPLCDFLHVERRRMTHRTRKMAKGSWQDQVTNVDEVLDYFAETKWASHLS